MKKRFIEVADEEEIKKEWIKKQEKRGKIEKDSK